MRKTLLFVCVVAAACGKGKDKAQGSSGSGVASGSAQPEAKPAPDQPEPAKPEPAKPAPAAKLVMPADVAADKAIGVAELDGYLKQWANDKELTVTGYPSFFIGDSDELRTSLKIAAEPGQKDDKAVVTCDLAASEKGKKVDNKTQLAIHGKLAGRWGSKNELVRMKDCTIVASAPADALPVDKLAQAYLGWFGKEVTVSGAFAGVTTSKSLPKDGGAVTDVRIDLLTEIGKWEHKLGCHLEKVEPDQATREGWQKQGKMTVKGTIKDVVFGGVRLEPCTVQ